MHKRSQNIVLRYVVAALILLGTSYVVWRNWDSLQLSLDAIKQIPLADFILAIGLVLLTFLFAASSYRALAFRRLRMGELYLVELASAAINRMVPSGVGGLSVHGLYLHKQKHTIPQATAVVSVNNLTSIAMHLSLLTLVLLFVGGSGLFAGSLPLQYLLIPIVLFAAAIGVLSLPSVRAKTQSFMRNLLVSIRRYRKEPQHVLVSAIVLLALTLTNVTILALMAQAVGINLSIVQIFIIYSAGVFVGASVPTPGGLAGVEAGLITGFIAYGVSSELAVAATLAFRLVTYWFPLIPGGLALVWARKLI